MPLKNDLYSVTIIDTLTKDHDGDGGIERKVRDHIIDYFNLGINEYRYPRDSIIGNMVQTAVKDLNVTDSGLTYESYERVGDGIENSQAIFIVGDDLYTVEVDSIVRKYRNDYYIDFVQV